MKFYLRVINPAIAIITLLLCFWAATYIDEEFTIYGIIIGGMGTYFFAKGLFASTSIFILGRILLSIILRREGIEDEKTSKLEFTYLIVVTVFLIGTLIGLYLLEEYEGKQPEAKSAYETIINPVEIQILEDQTIKESQYLRITGKLKNKADKQWVAVKLSAEVFIGGKFSDRESTEIDTLKANEERYFIIECDDFYNSKIEDEVTYELEVKVEKEVKKE